MLTFVEAHGQEPRANSISFVITRMNSLDVPVQDDGEYSLRADYEYSNKHTAKRTLTLNTTSVYEGQPP